MNSQRASQQLKGHLDLLLLAVLSDAPAHGYAVIEELRRRSGDAFDLPEGTVYPALHRLASSGLLEAEWSEVNGRRRKTYELTRRGRSALKEERVSWDEFVGAVRGVVGGEPWPKTR